MSGSASALKFVVSVDGSEVLDSAHIDAVAKERLDRVRGEDADTRYFHRYDADDADVGVNAIDLYRSIGENDPSGLPPGDLWVHVQTDFGAQDVTDTDYIAGGIWVFIPEDEEADEATYGVFVDGASEYPVAHVGQLTGESMYDGTAAGVYTDGRRNHSFEGTVALTADFDTPDPAGSIEGEIAGEVKGETFTLELQTAELTDGMNHFTGVTHVQFDGENYDGTWGGRFFNDTDDQVQDDHPGAAAGTFGATDSDDDKGFIGIFAAYLDDSGS